LSLSPHTVDLTVSILSSDAKAVVQRQEQRSSAELGRDAGVFRYAAGIPLKDLSPAVYSARVEAASRLGKGMIVAREVQFRVTRN
jgi:hypothetical protein